MSPPRKLAEIWDVDGGYHLRVEVGAFQRQCHARHVYDEQPARTVVV